MTTKNTLTNHLFMAFLGLVLVSVIPSFANAQSAPSLSSESANVTGSHNASLSTLVNPNGGVTELHFKYWTGSVFLEKMYFGVSGNSSIRIEVGLINLLEGTTYSYQVYAKNPYGSATGNTGSFTTYGSNGSSGSNTTNNGSNNNNNNSNGSGGSSSNAPLAPSVATNGPSSVSATSAVINGSVNANNVYTTFWFDFGNSPSLGQKTTVQAAGASNTWQLVTGNLSGLTTGVTYYYRVVAQNNLGTSFGELKSFTATNSGNSSSSSGGQVLGAVSGSGTGSNTSSGASSGTSGSTKFGSAGTSKSSATSTGSDSNQTNSRPSFISLEYSLADSDALSVVASEDKPKPGSEFSYTMVYKNDTGASFNEANLKAIIPVEAEYISANIEPMRISGNVVEFDLGNIPPNSGGSVTVVVRIKENTEAESNLIFTSVLGYKDRFGVQLATTSYLTAIVGQSESYGSASLFGFLSGSAVVWLIVLGLIVLAALAIYKLVAIRNKGKSDQDDIFGLGGIPPTFEPIARNNLSIKKIE